MNKNNKLEQFYLGGLLIGIDKNGNINNKVTYHEILVESKNKHKWVKPKYSNKDDESSIKGHTFI